MATLLPEEVAIRSERSAYAEAIPPGDVSAPCRGPVNIQALYDDLWQTPVTMAPVRITDATGVVLDCSARTQGLPSLGMQDGQNITPLRPGLGTLSFNSAQRGAVTGELVPENGAAAEVKALEQQILEELRGFASTMETALQPWILAWEDEGWWGVAKSLFEGAKRGVNAWWEGEGDFWSAVGDWFASLPDMAEDAWNGLSDTAKALWENKDRILQVLTELATGSVIAFQQAIQALKDIFAAIPSLEEISEILHLLVDQSAEWMGAMIEVSRQCPNVLIALGSTVLGVVMLTTPNFWAEMVGTVGGFLIPEIVLAIIFSIIAFFTAGTGGSLLAARLTMFAASVTRKLATVAGASGRVIVQIFTFLSSIGGKVAALARAAKRNVEEITRGATDSIMEILRGTKARVPPKRERFHRADLGDEWYDPDTGGLKWPPNDGFDAPPIDDVLTKDTFVDRYSALSGEHDRGNFLSPLGESFESRALPYNPDMQQYTVYKVVNDIPMQSGNAAPWFGQAGGAMQYKSGRTIGELVKDGYLEVVP